MSSVPVLYNQPHSNLGGRLLAIIYTKNLGDTDILVKSPEELGGTSSEQYLKLNPQGKIPLLVTEHGAISESDAIARYLLDRFGDRGETFTPSSLEVRTRRCCSLSHPRYPPTMLAYAIRLCALYVMSGTDVAYGGGSNVITCLHDTYIAPIQGCMYEAEPPFGAFSERSAAITQLQKYWHEVDEAVRIGGGPFMAGPTLSLADATLLPSVALLAFIAPKFLLPPPPNTPTPPWDTANAQPEPPLFFGAHVWQTALHLRQHPPFEKVWQEITATLQEWERQEHWKGMLHAGLRDNDAPTIFNRIISKKAEADVVYEDEHVLVFKDINPQAPTHLLLIPKERLLLSQLRFASPEHKSVLGTLLLTAAKVSKMLNLGGFRVVINDGAEAQQSVYHLHLHLLAGRRMRWPPG